MGKVLDVAERAWNGDLGDTNIHPGRALVGLEDLGEGLAFMSAFSNVAAIDTGDGLVFIDTSGPFHADQLFGDIRSWSEARVHTAVYTHGHVDHVFGLGPFEAEATSRGWEPTCVIAHEACPDRFDRYQLTNGYNGVINSRQFNFPKPVFPRKFRYPDRTLRRQLELTVGSESIELYHDRGETDDHVWAWLPERKVIYTGDLFIWAAPNCGNPQKAQRYPREWSMALRKMQKLGPELLLPGHGPPIVGRERVGQALGEAAELLETVVEQTLAMMNAGARLDEILHSVEVPERLTQRPYLRPIYDDPLFIVPNLWRLYGGWYDGNPAHLKPAADSHLARVIADMAGGAEALARRAESLVVEGELALAAHLVEYAVQAEPENRRIHDIRAEVYRARVAEESSLMAKAIFAAAARDSDPDAN